MLLIEIRQKVSETSETMSVAGAQTWKDNYDDVTLIPVWGDLRSSDRYKQATAALETTHTLTLLLSIPWQDL